MIIAACILAHICIAVTISAWYVSKDKQIVDEVGTFVVPMTWPVIGVPALVYIVAKKNLLKT
jgi:hypothetical protein